jgi:drug/metabolite transporter (DMT)-like permease
VSRPARHSGGSRLRTGIALALASSVTYGASAFVLGGYAVRTGWLVASLVPYGSSVTALLLALPFRRRPAARPGGRSGFAWAAAAGVAEAAALVALACGGQARQVAVTGGISSLYPALPLAVGLVIYREPISRRQVLGVVFVIAGMILMTLAQPG